jgi:transcriptional regulator with XRE-family HTH domain
MEDRNIEFGKMLRDQRLGANIGLRKFAELIEELPSNLSAVEKGKRTPWRTPGKLRAAADALALTEGSLTWDKFFLAARRPDVLPFDVERLIYRDVNLALLRAVDDANLSDEEVTALVEQIRSGRSISRVRKSRPTK